MIEFHVILARLFFAKWNIVMGNCNDKPVAQQKCQGCGRGSCGEPCTAGLDKYCGRCDPSWVTQNPGLYDTQYNQWAATDPEPRDPSKTGELEELIPITFNVTCAECTSNITIEDIEAHKLSIGDISTSMSCLEQKKEEVIAADEELKRLEEIRKAEEAAAAEEALRKKKIMIFIVLLFIVVVVGGLLIYKVFTGKPSTQNTEAAPQIAQ